MKVLFINPPIRLQEPPKHIPYGMAILVSIADGMGLNVAVLDLNAYRLPLEVVKEEISEESYDTVCIGGLTTQYKFIKQYVKLTRQVQPDTLIVAGGGFFTVQPKEMMEWLPEVDIGVIGEGEETFVEVLEKSVSGRWNEVKGIVYRENDELVFTEPRPLIGYGTNIFKKLEDIPYPAWGMFPLEDVYFQNSSLLLSPEVMNARRRLDVITERGCNHTCEYCVHLGMSSHDLKRIYGDNIKGPNLRYFSAEYTVGMIKYMRLKYAVDFISFLDENFTANRKRCFEICDLLEREDLVGVVNFGCLGSVDTVDRELLQRLKDVGFTYISYGGESANNHILKQIGKNTTVEQMQSAIQETKRVGINPVMTFMEGYPGEKVDDMIQTVEFWENNDIFCRPFFVQPYPGTEMFYTYRNKILEQYGDLESYVLDLDDAQKLTVNLTDFSDCELLGLRELMTVHDLRRLKKFKKSKEVEGSGLD